VALAMQQSSRRVISEEEGRACAMPSGKLAGGEVRQGGQAGKWPRDSTSNCFVVPLRPTIRGNDRQSDGRRKSCGDEGMFSSGTSEHTLYIPLSSLHFDGCMHEGFPVINAVP
jgi:hypothetical protein